MAHGLDPVETGTAAAPTTGAAGLVEYLFSRLNQFIVLVASIALVAASVVLTYSVIVRYFLKISTDWQDEMSVFLIIGAVFMSSAAIQARRGHVAIEAVSSMLSPAANHVRLIVVDIMSLLFCGFFTWKSWTLLEEAWVDNFHSGSTWGPPLWVPYSLMTFGMMLLTFQILLQVVGAFLRRRAPA